MGIEFWSEGKKIVRLNHADIAEISTARESKNFMELYLHTNDQGHDKVINETRRLIGETPKVQDSSALFVGTGGMLSLATEIPQTNWVMADFKWQTLAWQMHSCQVMRTAETRNQYTELMYSTDNPVIQAAEGDTDELIAALQYGLVAEQRDLGILHFLASDYRYNKSREALLQKNLAFVCIDLTKPDQSEILANSMKAHGMGSLEFMHMTNLADYGIARTDLYKSLGNLNIANNAVFIYSEKEDSTSLHYTSVTPVMQKPCVGLAQYASKSRIPGSNIPDWYKGRSPRWR